MVQPRFKKGKRLDSSHPCAFHSFTADQHGWGSKTPFESLWILKRDDGSRESKTHTHKVKERDPFVAL